MLIASRRPKNWPSASSSAGSGSSFTWRAQALPLPLYPSVGLEQSKMVAWNSLLLSDPRADSNRRIDRSLARLLLLSRPVNLLRT